jgi:autoinducer 2-degrading protein
MITRIVKLHFQEDKISDFLALFDQVVTKVNAFDGCQKMYMLRDIHNPAVFITHSIWNSENDLNAYRDSELFQSIWPTIKPWFAEKAQAWSLSTDF